MRSNCSRSELNDKNQNKPLPIEIRLFANNSGLFSGEDENGKRWLVSEADAIEALQEGTLSFHISLDGREIPIIVAADLAGNKFLATRVDGKITDDLLSLPDFVPHENLPGEQIHRGIADASKLRQAFA